MRLTREWLRKHECCRTQVDLFHRNFPGGLEVTVENFDLAAPLFSVLDLFIFAAKAMGRDEYEEMKDRVERLSVSPIENYATAARSIVRSYVHLFRIKSVHVCDVGNVC